MGWRALAFTAEVRDRSKAVIVTPGPRHWRIFTRLCRECGVKGSLVTDANFTALALESGCEWITTDRDYTCLPAWPGSIPPPAAALRRAGPERRQERMLR